MKKEKKEKTKKNWATVACVVEYMDRPATSRCCLKKFSVFDVEESAWALLLVMVLK